MCSGVNGIGCDVTYCNDLRTHLVFGDETCHPLNTLPGPITPMKIPGGSSYSQYDMLVGDGMSDNWHRTPGNKMGPKATTTPSWPPGKWLIDEV